MSFAYSFLDVQASIIGPGGSFSLGAGAAPSEEGITIEMVEDKNTMTIGADGTPMHSLHGGNGGKVIIRLQKTSPVNNSLSLMYALQKSSSTLWGGNIFVLKNSLGDVITCRACAFKKAPTQTNAKEAGHNEWEFDAGIVDTTLAGLLLSVAG